MKHTSEPWKVIPNNHGFGTGIITGPPPDAITQARYMPIAKTMEYRNKTYPCFYEVNSDEQGANAECIVACVNACKGINPEAVPMMKVAIEGVIEWLDISSVRKLLIGHDCAMGLEVHLENLQEAIAKAEEVN